MECIRRLVNTLGQSARSVEQRTGVTNAQLFLLREIANADGSSINELAARAKRPNPGATSPEPSDAPAAQSPRSAGSNRVELRMNASSDVT